MAPIPECVSPDYPGLLENEWAKEAALEQIKDTTLWIINDTAEALRGAGLDPEDYYASHLAVDPEPQPGDYPQSRAAHLVVARLGPSNKKEYYAVGARPSQIQGEPYRIELYELQDLNSTQESPIDYLSLQWQITTKQQIIYTPGINLIPIRSEESFEITDRSAQRLTSPEQTAENIIRAAKRYARRQTDPPNPQDEIIALSELGKLLELGVGRAFQKIVTLKNGAGEQDNPAEK